MLICSKRPLKGESLFINTKLDYFKVNKGSDLAKNGSILSDLVRKHSSNEKGMSLAIKTSFSQTLQAAEH